MPGASHVGVSQRIETEAERDRLKKVVNAYCDEQGGFIIRTAAEGVCEEDLSSDAAYLKRVWTKVSEHVKNVTKHAASFTVNWRWHNAYCVILPTRHSIAFVSTPA